MLATIVGHCTVALHFANAVANAGQTFEAIPVEEIREAIDYIIDLAIRRAGKYKVVTFKTVKTQTGFAR
eukprot:7754708-Pyramimonas_sp.AAC.1